VKIYNLVFGWPDLGDIGELGHWVTFVTDIGNGVVAKENLNNFVVFNCGKNVPIKPKTKQKYSRRL